VQLIVRLSGKNLQLVFDTSKPAGAARRCPDDLETERLIVISRGPHGRGSPKTITGIWSGGCQVSLSAKPRVAGFDLRYSDSEYAQLRLVLKKSFGAASLAWAATLWNSSASGRILWGKYAVATANPALAQWK
jgi:hypothetical protein